MERAGHEPRLAHAGTIQLLAKEKQLSLVWVLGMSLEQTRISYSQQSETTLTVLAAYFQK